MKQWFVQLGFPAAATLMVFVVMFVWGPHPLMPAITKGATLAAGAISGVFWWQQTRRWYWSALAVIATLVVWPALTAGWWLIALLWGIG